MEVVIRYIGKIEEQKFEDARRVEIDSETINVLTKSGTVNHQINKKYVEEILIKRPEEPDFSFRERVKHVRFMGRRSKN